MAWVNLKHQQKAIELLASRGVSLTDIAEVTFFIQKEYFPGLTIEQCEENVKKVLEKTEVQNALFTGIAIDELAEQGKLPEPLSTIVNEDQGLYGVDEILALGIVNIYGSIGLTNFGYVDKAKIGIIKKIDEIGKTSERCMTFTDDIVGAIAAAAASRIAHNNTKRS
jgi:phosphatidylglycerophosphatase A